MISKKFKEALMIVQRKITGKEIPWAVVASANLAMQGINIKPSDLDLTVPFENLSTIAGIFKEYIISNIESLSTTTGEPAWDVKLKINDVEVQFVGERPNGLYVSSLLAERVTFVEVDGMRIPCLNLDAEIEAYTATTREDKAKLIREFLGK